jgi:hypothetical protein
MPHSGALRNFESTVRSLAERGHQVHLAFERREKPGLASSVDLVARLSAERHGVTSGLHPDPFGEALPRTAGRMRTAVDSLRFEAPEFATGGELRRRAREWLPLPLGLRGALAASPRLRGEVTAALRRAERAAPQSRVSRAYLRERAPDVVLVTPLVEPGSCQTDFVRAAKSLGIPTCLCVSSWDNLTNKGLIHEVPDGVVVWNEQMSSEAVALHGLPADRVVVTGAAAYDHWFGRRPTRTRQAFAQAAGIDAGRPFVLYVGSSAFIAPGESAFVGEWLRGLREHGLGDLQVIARPHPLNPLVGAGEAAHGLGGEPNLVIFPAGGADPTDEVSREDYFDSLHFAAAVVGVNTSAFIEAGILGRHVLTLLTPRYRGTQTGQPHFHHLLRAGGGLLHVAENPRDHATQVGAALAATPGTSCRRSAFFTRAFVRPFGLGEAATPRVVDAIEGVSSRRRGPAPPRPPSLRGVASRRA